MIAQPMPFFMAAPVDVQQSVGQATLNVQMASPYAVPEQPTYGIAQAWPMEGQWMNTNVNAPQQCPMEAYSAQETFMPNCGQRDFSARGQETSRMDLSTQALNAGAIAIGARALRNRRAKAARAASERSSDEDVACGGQPEHESGTEVPSTYGAPSSQSVADELLRQLKDGPEGQWAAVGRFGRLAFSSKVSSRAAQLALQDASVSDAAVLAHGLRGHVLPAVQSKHANYVVQKIMEVVPMVRVSFITEELTGFACEVACHEFGCRVLCRLLEHASFDEEATGRLLEELFMNIGQLCSHSFGSYVVRHILEFGLPEHRRRVTNELLPYVSWLATGKLGSHVVEAALRFCPPEDLAAIVAELLAYEDRLVSIATSQFGRYVIRALLEAPEELRQKVVDALTRVEPQLSMSKVGKSTLLSVRSSQAAPACSLLSSM
jgi:hypothetical protein